MKHSANRLLWLAIGLAMMLPLAADTTFQDLDMLVELQDNGDARITEVRSMTIDSEVTEGFIVIGNLHGSKIKDFSVSDETGYQFEVEDSWDIHRSRFEKEHRCGILPKSNGDYELCWGFGQGGQRVYTVRYTLTSVVRSYSDADGFNWKFIADHISPSPQQVKVRVCLPDSVPLPNEEALKAWGFGFYGDVMVMDREVIAETDGELTPEGQVILMLRLEKGVLHPTMPMSGSFDQVMNRAFEGSDYGGAEPARPKTFMEKAADMAIFVFSALLFIVPLLLVGYWAWWSRRERKRMKKDLLWYRDIPMDGNLVSANAVLKCYELKANNNTDHLLSAMVLRLLNAKALRIEEHYLEPSRLKKLIGGEGKVQQCIVIGDYDEADKRVNTRPMRTLYEIFCKASGDDQILQPHELTRWMSRNQQEVMTFLNSIGKSMSYKEGRQKREQVRQVLGLKKFLKEFTLANERHLSEVGLWNDYLIYAELFGIADQVRKDMEKLNPEYLKMDKVLQEMNNRTVLPAFTSALVSGTRSVQRAQSRSSGGGGRSSFGGGGGSFGGGSGGGAR